MNLSSLEIEAQPFPNDAWMRLQLLLHNYPLENQGDRVAIFFPDKPERPICGVVWFDRRQYWNAIVESPSAWQQLGIAHLAYQREQIQQAIAIALAPFLDENVFKSA